MEPTIKVEKNRSITFLLAVIATVLVIYGLAAAKEQIAPFLMAAFLAVICYPFLSLLRSNDFPEWASLLIVIGSGVIILLLILLLIGASAVNFQNHLNDYGKSLNTQIERWSGWLETYGIGVSELQSSEMFSTQRLVRLVGDIFGSIQALLGNIFIVLLLFVFMLIEASEFPAKLAAIGGGKSKRDEEVDQILENVRHYIMIKSIVSAVTGVLVTIWLAILGVDFALLWGLLAFFFNFVPNIGSIIAAIPPVILTIVQPGMGLGTAVWVALGYTAINIVIGNVVEPRVMGRGLGLSTLVVFISLIFWGAVLGPVGMVLSVPLTIIARIVLAGHERTRWIAILLAGNPSDVEAAYPSEKA